MRGLTWLFFTVLVNSSVSHVILSDILQSAIQNLRSKREATCGEVIDLDLTGGVGEIQLRTEVINGTEFYKVYEDCTWTLKTSKDHFMVLKSEYFSVEESDNCMSDFVEITEEEFDVDVARNRFCGWDPLTYITFSNEIQLQFKSDVSYEDKGFKFIIESVKNDGDESKCVGSIFGGKDSRIINNKGSGDSCLYRIQAPEDKVITLNLRMLNFGSASCDVESIVIYEGISTHGTIIGRICSDSVNGMLPYHASSMVIEYRNTLQQEGERFTLEYMFVEDNFTPAPVPSTTPSPVGGNNDCSGMFKGIDTDDSVMVYTAPKYANNKECVVVVRNEQLPRHVVQIEFVYFDIEESDDCIFDSLKIRSGEREESAALGGPYCGESLDKRTFLTRGNSLRLEFKTDVSFALKGFQANISFVPTSECSCEKSNEICIRQDFEKKCVRGRDCEANICQNGGTCIKSGSTQKCYCPKGYSGDDCSQSEGGTSFRIRFKNAPGSRTLKRTENHMEECEVEVPPGEDVKYYWTFHGILIEQYEKRKGFGTHPGGFLQIDGFSDEMEGPYSCFAKTSAGIAEHTFEYRITENCDVRIYPGPQSESKKINEMALLVCRVDSRRNDSRAKEVRWKKDGVIIDYTKDSRIKKMSNNYLYISNVGLSDAGTYQCEAEDENGCYSYKEGKLQVLDVKPINKYCGRSVHDEDTTASSRITRGSEALPNMHPWHVTFRSRGNATYKNAFCGGTLISQRFVVTAAHCIKEFKDRQKVHFIAENVELLLGTTDCMGTKNDIIRRTVGNVTVHPDYEDNAAYDNDIALIELDSPVEYTDSVRPICLEPANYNDRVFLENSRSIGPEGGKVAGCGAYKNRLRLQPKNLQEIHIPYVYREQCIKSLGDKKDMLTDTMFCAGSNIGRTGDTCGGDSGGGLVMLTSERWVLTGIVSWGIGCDVDKHYGVYTNAGIFYNWIDGISKFRQEETPDFRENLDHEVCIHQDSVKKCIRGQYCPANICQNGGTCIKSGSTQTCYCPNGYSGDDCSQSEREESYHIRFVKAPASRTIKRDQSHTEECQVEVPQGEEVNYFWSFNGNVIEQYERNVGFGSHPGGLLQIDHFSDEMKGSYSCFAKTSAGIAEHTFEYRITENCDVSIYPGPQSEIKKINEMALLICRVHSRPKEVRWKKDGIYIDYTKDSRIKKMSNNYLYISNIGLSDAGTYQCEAEDEHGCYIYKKGKLQVIDVKPINKYCGRSIHDEAISASSRISRGSEAIPNMHPWHVTFRSKGNAGTKIAFCGGTLISQRFVVTAAQCINYFKTAFRAPFIAENVEFILGTTDCMGTKNDGIRRTVGNVTVHPDYEDRIAHDNDIALIELDSPVKYTESVRPICLEPADYNDRMFLENSESIIPVVGKVAGCGALRGGRFTRQPKNLQDIHIPYVYRAQCIDSLGNKKYMLTDTMFCAGSNIGRTGDTCGGDSGGGLVMPTPERWVLNGIVSWGIGCDVDQYYGVYTNTGIFYDWIDGISKFSQEETPDFMENN